MPTVKIELLAGRDIHSLKQMRDLVMDAVVEVLQLPFDDRNVRLIEYHPEMFQMKPPYEILIEISMFEGRTKETKRALYQRIVESLESNGIINKDKVLITLNEQPMENWGVRGGQPADEVNFGFTVKI